jgi:hypothetical protein
MQNIDIDLDQIDFNYSLFESLQHYEEKNMPKTIQIFKAMLKQGKLDAEKRILIETNLGVVYFYNYQYNEAYHTLQNAYESLSQGSNAKQLLKTPMGKSLAVKILSNLCIISIVNNNYDNAKEFNKQALSFIIQQ